MCTGRRAVDGGASVDVFVAVVDVAVVCGPSCPVATAS